MWFGVFIRTIRGEGGNKKDEKEEHVHIFVFVGMEEEYTERDMFCLLPRTAGLL